MKDEARIKLHMRDYKNDSYETLQRAIDLVSNRFSKTTSKASYKYSNSMCDSVLKLMAHDYDHIISMINISRYTNNEINDREYEMLIAEAREYYDRMTHTTIMKLWRGYHV